MLYKACSVVLDGLGQIDLRKRGWAFDFIAESVKRGAISQIGAAEDVVGSPTNVVTHVASPRQRYFCTSALARQ